MEDTAAANDEFIKIVSIGKSYEGREMNVIEIRKAVGTSAMAQARLFPTNFL